MKKIVFIVLAFLTLSVSNVFAQLIKIENGASFSWMQGDVLESKLPAYSVMFGCDYLEHDWFYLSSEIGYIKKGGKDKIYGFIEDLGNDAIRGGYANMQSNLQYIQLNTSFRVKHSFKKINVYAGIAPTLDFLVKEESYTETEIKRHDNDYHANKFVLGIMPEIGAFYDVNKLRVSLNVSYQRNISHLAKVSNGDGLNNNTLLVSVGVGYKL